MAQPYAARLVGRDAEIGALRVELDAALGGEGRLVVLIGDAGIGKTRTATALATEARDRGAVIVWGRCHEGEGAPVYWPWVQALGAYVAERAGRGVEEIALLLPLLRARAAAPDAVPEQARFELFDRVAQALVAAAREHPLAVVLDDLHWADHGSLLLLEFVAREIGTARLLVLATLRDAELRQRSDVAPLLATVLRLGHGVPLRGLPPDAVRELLSDRMGKPPGDALVDEVLAVTDGNPFFVIELAQLLALDGADGGAARRRPVIPPGAQELLRRRLAPMPPASRRLLEAAAVVGREFDLGPLATIMAAPVADLVAALEPALRAGLVRTVPDVLRRYTFTHALMRETLYDDIASGARMQLHAAVGEALETSGTADEKRLPMLAHHFFEAAQGGDPVKAVRYGCEAGERALRLLAFEEAVRHFERALAAVALVGDEEARLRVLAGLADALHGTGNQERAEAVFRDALGVARGRGASTFAEAVLRFAGARAELGAPDFEMSALLEEALAGLPPEPGALRARVMVRLAAGLLVQPGSEAYRKVLADDALEIARGLGDPTALAFVLTRRQVALVGPDTLDERLATTDEVLRMGTGGRAAELEALTFRLHGLAELGDRAGLDHVLAVFEQKAWGFRHPGFLWTAASARAAMALLEGRFADAETLAGEALALGQRVQTRTPMLNYAQQLFMLRGEQGRLAEVEPLITAGVAETAVVPAWRVGLASFYCFVRRDVEARCEFDALAEGDFAGLPRDSAWLTGIYLLGTVCGQLRDLRRAEVLYELTRPYAGRIAVGGPLVVFVGVMDARLGLLAGLLGRYAAADKHFADALAVAERLRGLPFQAHIRWEWAATLVDRAGRGDRERAATLLDQAETIARPLGMALLLGWIEETRERARSAGPPVARAEAAQAVAEGGARRAVLTVVPRSPAGETKAASRSARDAGPRAGVFRRDGDVWTLVFENRTTRLRDMVGLGHLVRLLGAPGREIHVNDLVAGAYEGRRDGEAAGAAAGDAGELLDPKARAEYEARLREAREELEEAKGLNDRGRAERLGEEVEFLVGELARGYGLGGRARRAGSTAERARVAVTRAIKYAVDRIAEHDAALAEHLRVAVRTGTFCVYEPPSLDRVAWTL